MKITRVGNKRDRATPDDFYIGRPSVFGNPFVIGKDGDREQVISKYREWFYQKLKDDVQFLIAVNGLKGKRLICWCSPQRCHGDVIAEFLNSTN